MNSEQRPQKRCKNTTHGVEEMMKIHKLMAAHESFISIERTLPLTPNGSVNKLRMKFEEAVDRLCAEYEMVMRDLTEHAAVWFLSGLLDNHDHDDRNNENHDKETVGGVMTTFPEALKHYEALRGGDDYGREDYDEEKGGLASTHHHSGPNTALTNIVRRYVMPNATSATTNSTLEDVKKTAILQELFEYNILKKKDIIDFGMIYFSASNDTKIRFNLLVDLCPEGLATCVRNSSGNGDLPIQCDAKIRNEDGFGMLLKAGLRYYPRELGFLLHMHADSGERTIDTALSECHLNLTHDDLFKLIHEVIPPTSTSGHTVLIDVIRLAPEYASLFHMYYPNTIYTQSPDPDTGLYPFMSAATAGCDLKVIYHLLRHDPDAWVETSRGSYLLEASIHDRKWIKFTNLIGASGSLSDRSKGIYR